MRTTVTLEPDVERLLKDDMHAQDRSLKEVLNDAVRRGYAASATERPPRYIPMTFDMGPILVPQANLNHLADELEDAELLAKLRAGR